jgi:hypothetical protein
MSSGSRPMGSGSRPMGSGSRPMGSGSRPMGSGSRPMGSGSRPMGSGSRPMGSGSRPMGSGSRPMGFGSRYRLEHPLDGCHQRLCVATTDAPAKVFEPVNEVGDFPSAVRAAGGGAEMGPTAKWTKFVNHAAPGGGRQKGTGSILGQCQFRTARRPPPLCCGDRFRLGEKGCPPS